MLGETASWCITPPDKKQVNFQAEMAMGFLGLSDVHMEIRKFCQGKSVMEAEIQVGHLHDLLTSICTSSAMG